MKDFLVLTSTLGGKDRLLDPTQVFDSCDYIAIVDQQYNVDTWQQFGNYQFSSIDEYTHRRNAKLYKAISTILFPDYKYIVWHDANHELIKDPADIVNEYGDADWYALEHPLRDCVYEEMKVIRGNLDRSEIIDQQNDYYRSKNFPSHYGLYAMGNTIRKNSPTVTTLELKWWEQITKFSSRDQCSFMYCLWDMEQSGIEIVMSTLRGFKENTLTQNEYFIDRGTRLK